MSGKELLSVQLAEQIELKRRVFPRSYVRIIGLVASGKTTLLNTIYRMLDLQKVGWAVGTCEPEDTVKFRPEAEQRMIKTIINYTYDRSSSRGPKATLGSEMLNVLATSRGSTTNYVIYSQGGHLRADCIYGHLDSPDSEFPFGALGVLFDYDLLKKMADLHKNIDPQKILPNEETVLQTVLSMLRLAAEVDLYHQPTKLGVISKLPHGERVTGGVVRLVDRALKSIVIYARYHYDMILSESQETKWGEILQGLSFCRMSDQIKTWLPIYNDRPDYSGSLEVLHRLVQLGQKRCGSGDSDRVRLVSFADTIDPADPNIVSYTAVEDLL